MSFGCVHGVATKRLPLREGVISLSPYHQTGKDESFFAIWQDRGHEDMQKHGKNCSDAHIIPNWVGRGCVL